MTNEVIAVTNAAIVSEYDSITGDTRKPLHDWTFHVGYNEFGFFQWGPPKCQISFGHHMWSVPFSAPAVVAALLLIVALLLFGAFYLIANRTRKSDPDDA